MEKIKPISGVITHVEDITTQKCRQTLKKELKHWKADVFLHDGAPNVGISWLQDAFTQSELTLSALKLATEFLMPNGTFVTKVFRSKDYNKLIWVMNQLFSSVEATKPSASRNVSAEIFVVCQGYLAPKKIDPRLLDPKYAFKELDDVPTEVLDPKQMKEKQGQIMNDLFHPEKRRRFRDGYADGDYTLHYTRSVSDFISSLDFMTILSTQSGLIFEETNKMDQEIKNHPLTTDEVREYINDLKVLGKKEFKTIMKWREMLRISLGLAASFKNSSKKEEEAETENEELTVEELIEKEKDLMEHKLKKDKKKRRERKAKAVIKLQLGMACPADIGIEGQQISTQLAEIDMGTDEVENKKYEKNENSVAESKEDSETEESYDTDEETRLKVSRLDSQMNELYEQYQQRLVESNPTRKVKKMKTAIAEQFEEWYGVESELNEKKNVGSSEANDTSSDDEDSGASDLNCSDDEQELDDNLKTEKERSIYSESAKDNIETNNLSTKAKMFFDNPLFKKSGIFNAEMTNTEVKKQTDEKNIKKVDKMAAFEEEEAEKDIFQIVPTKKSDDDEIADSNYRSSLML